MSRPIEFGDDVRNRAIELKKEGRTLQGIRDALALELECAPGTNWIAVATRDSKVPLSRSFSKPTKGKRTTCECGKESMTDRLFCIDCAQKRRLARSQKRAATVCKVCGSAPVPGTKYCQPCRDKRVADRALQLAPRPCPNCGVEVTGGRTFCPACTAQRLKNGANKEPCKVCGKERPKSRAACVTCSVECQVEIKRRVDDLARKSCPCKECGASIVGEAARNRTFCSDECRVNSKARRAKESAKPCTVCQKPCRAGRHTCSDECHKEAVLKGSHFGARSESKRASRSKARKASYKGKDKVQLVESLTAKQGGKCKVCGHTGFALGNGKIGLVLDHCHRTGKARAMLCAKCNAALGQMSESPDKIRALLKYAVELSQCAIAI